MKKTHISKLSEPEFSKYDNIKPRILQGLVEYLQLEEEDPELKESDLDFVGAYKLWQDNVGECPYFVWSFKPKWAEVPYYGFVCLRSKGDKLELVYNYGEPEPKETLEEYLMVDFMRDLSK